RGVVVAVEPNVAAHRCILIEAGVESAGLAGCQREGIRGRRAEEIACRRDELYGIAARVQAREAVVAAGIGRGRAQGGRTADQVHGDAAEAVFTRVDGTVGIGIGPHFAVCGYGLEQTRVHVVDHLARSQRHSVARWRAEAVTARGRELHRVRTG